MQTKEQYRTTVTNLNGKIAGTKERLKAAQREYNSAKRHADTAAAEIQRSMFLASQGALFAPANGYSTALKTAADTVSKLQSALIELTQELDNLPLPNQTALF